LTESRAASRHGQRADMRERVQALIDAGDRVIGGEHIIPAEG